MINIEYKTYNEFWGYFFRVTQRHNIEGIFEWDKNLVNFIEYVCKTKSGMKVLDLACGGGDQAKIFSAKGYKVTGIDKVPSLIHYAKKQFEMENLIGDFFVKDMRDIDYENEFDLITILSGSFGFFSDKENQDLLKSIYRALKKDGRVFISFLTLSQFKNRNHFWYEKEDGWYLNEDWLDLEKSTYNSTHMIIKKDGTVIKPAKEKEYNANEIIRCYSIPEMKQILSNAKLTYINSFNSRNFTIPPVELDNTTPRNIVVAKK